jgi:hypothetical protein
MGRVIEEIRRLMLRSTQEAVSKEKMDIPKLARATEKM